MRFRQALLAVAIALTWPAASAAAPSVEIASEAGPHGTAPKKWLQRLDEAGAGTTRLVAGGDQPRLEDLGQTRSGKPLVKVYAVLTRRGELLLPSAGGAERYRLSDTAKLAEYFDRLSNEGIVGVESPRGKRGLTKAEFTDLYTRLSSPMPALNEGVTLRDAVNAAARVARVDVDIDPVVRGATSSAAEGGAEVAGVSVGTALAMLLRQEGLALVVDKPIGKPASLRVVAAAGAKEPWPLGYEPDRSPSQTAPALMEFLTVEVEDYTLQEAFDAITPRLSHRGKPLPVVWDRFALRRDAIDPQQVVVSFPRKRTFYKKLLDQLAFQARLSAELRIDEAGAPLLWITR